MIVSDGCRRLGLSRGVFGRPGRTHARRPAYLLPAHRTEWDRHDSPGAELCSTCWTSGGCGSVGVAAIRITGSGHVPRVEIVFAAGSGRFASDNAVIVVCVYKNLIGQGVTVCPSVSADIEE